MHRAIFNTMGHHAHMYVMYEGAKHYVIASNLNEGLFALIDSKTDTPPELWQWVRCESVELIKTGWCLALIVSELQFNDYLSAVRLKTPVHDCPSIHRQEHDIAYQINHNGEFVTIGRYTPPSEYLIFDVLCINKTPKHTPQSGGM